MPEKINWKKLYLENWIPRLGSAILTLIGIAVIGPYVQDIYTKNSNFHEDRKHFYNEFTQNFGDLRVVARNMLLACEKNPSCDVHLYQQDLETSYNKLWIESYGIVGFFGKESEADVFNFFTWFRSQPLICENVKKLFEGFLTAEQVVTAKMRKSIYGNKNAHP